MLIDYGKFIGASGKELDWKIDCDSLTQSDIDSIVLIAGPHLPSYNICLGVPRGGIMLASAFQRASWKTEFYTPSTLIVDDVWTTGSSMYNFVKEKNIDKWNGFVIFARGPLPENVKCLFKLELGN